MCFLSKNKIYHDKGKWIGSQVPKSNDKKGSTVWMSLPTQVYYDHSYAQCDQKAKIFVHLQKLKIANQENKLPKQVLNFAKNPQKNGHIVKNFAKSGHSALHITRTRQILTSTYFVTYYSIRHKNGPHPGKGNMKVAFSTLQYKN